MPEGKLRLVDLLSRPSKEQLLNVGMDSSNSRELSRAILMSANFESVSKHTKDTMYTFWRLWVRASDASSLGFLL